MYSYGVKCTFHRGVLVLACIVESTKDIHCSCYCPSIIPLHVTSSIDPNLSGIQLQSAETRKDCRHFCTSSPNRGVCEREHADSRTLFTAGTSAASGDHIIPYKFLHLCGVFSRIAPIWRGGANLAGGQILACCYTVRHNGSQNLGRLLKIPNIETLKGGSENLTDFF